MKFSTNGFNCFGYEKEPLECPHDEFSYCTEYDAAGVICSSKNSIETGVQWQAHSALRGF